MPSGIVAELSLSKGYGFILDSDSGTYIRFDIQTLLDEVFLHDMVNYNIVELYPGKMAVNVRKDTQKSSLELDHDADSRQHRSGGIGDGT